MTFLKGFTHAKMGKYLKNPLCIYYFLQKMSRANNIAISSFYGQPPKLLPFCRASIRTLDAPPPEKK